MRDREAHRYRVVRAMDQIGAVAGGEPHGELAERIVRSRGHSGRQRVAGREMFLAHRLGRIPHRVLDFLDDVRKSKRRMPVHFADADWVGDHFAAEPSRFGFRIIVQPMFRQIYHDAFTRARAAECASPER